MPYRNAPNEPKAFPDRLLALLRSFPRNDELAAALLQSYWRTDVRAEDLALEAIRHYAEQYAAVRKQAERAAMLCAPSVLVMKDGSLEQLCPACGK